VNHAQFSPIAAPSRPELLAEQLRTAIARGALPAGSQLTEAELARSFAVSRGPLREAMARLIAEGLLVSIPHRGIFVVELSDADVADIYALRGAVEKLAAQRLAQTRDDVVVARLREICQSMRDALKADDYTAMSDADHQFHVTLVESANSPRLMRSVSTLLVETRMCLSRLEDKYDWPMAAVDEHDDIVTAIESGDTDAVDRALTSHMNEAAALITGERETSPR
jgi:DNA-binding GntR family transcriptional regulator